MTDANVAAILPTLPQPINPLQTLSGWQDYANKRLVGQQIQQNTANLAQENQIRQQQFSVAQTNRAAQNLYSLMNLPDSALTNGGPLYQKLQDGIQSGEIDPQHAAVIQSQLDAIKAQNPNGDVPGSAYRPYLNSVFAATLTGPEQAKFLVGSPTTVNTGQQYVGAVQGGLGSNAPGAVMPTGGSIPLQLTPGEAATRVQGPPNAAGGPTTVPLGSVTPGYGGTAPAPLNNGAGTAPSPNAPPRLNMPGNGGAAAPATAIPGQITVGLPPGQNTAMEVSSAQYAKDRADAGNFAGRIFPLQQALTLSNETPTGPGTNWVNNVRGFLVASAQQLGLDPGKVQTANYDELSKYLTQATMSNPMAAGSDSRLASMFAGSPNTHINQLAVQNTLKAQIAMLRMQQAATLGYQGQPSGYADYLRSYSTKVDPRAFAIDMLDDKQQQALAASLKTPQQRQQFAYSLGVAKQYGLFTNNAMPANQ
jgi:hypothetical protein